MFEISRILSPVVFSENCRGALACAVSIASRFGAELTVLHVLEPLTSMQFDTTTANEEIGKYRRDWVRRALGDFTFGLHPRIQVREVCTEGDAAAQIVKFAEESKTNLIVIASHGYGTFRRFLLGSVTAKVLHDSHCAVWTGAHLERNLARTTGPCDLHSVLCAVNFGPQADPALEWSAGMAAAWNARVSVIHVVPDLHDAPRQLAACDEASQWLEERCKAGNIKADREVVVGNATEEIARAATRVGADLLVIGRGHLKFGGRLRSTSYAILRESPCPVVSV